MQKSIHLFQPQYAVKNDNGRVSYWLPYSIGCLWAYVCQNPDLVSYYRLAELHYRRERIHQLIERLDRPYLCGFSCYVWNEQYCLAAAAAIKQKWPECLIVFGGPQAGSGYLRYDFIDSIVFGEGEGSFAMILDNLRLDQKPDKFYRKKRLENLNVPSPYLLGLFDDIVNSAGTDTQWQTVLETNRGCPFACTFCDWGSVTYSKVKKFDLQRVEQELQWIRNHNVTTVHLGDANFGIFKERDMQIARMIKHYFEDSKVDYVNPTYSKNSNETVFQIAKAMGSVSKSVTLSMQSMNTATLKAIKRDNLKSNDLSELLDLSERYGLPTYTEMILGLPEETLETWCHGICELLELNQHNFSDVFFTSMLENAELNQSQREKYNIKTVQASNFMIGSVNDDSDIPEANEIVCETNTMSRDDMCEAYMFSWMVQNFHWAGYSQVLAKFCRHVLAVPYRVFYDRLQEKLIQDQGAIGNHRRFVADQCALILKHGDMHGTSLEVHTFLSCSVWPLYQLLPEVIDLVTATAAEFGDIDPAIVDIQKRFVINDIWPAAEVHCSRDLDSWQQENCVYTMYLKSDKISINETNAIRYRRRGWMKHQLQKVTP